MTPGRRRRLVALALVVAVVASLPLLDDVPRGEAAATTALPTISVGDVSTLGATTGGRSARFVVALSQPPVLEVTAHYATAPGAADPSGFRRESGTVTFDPGQQVTTVAVPVTIHSLAGIDHAFSLHLSRPVNARAGRMLGYGSIVSSAPASSTAALSMGDAAVPQSCTNTLTAWLPIVLDEPMPHPETVTVTSVAGTAVAGVDFVPVNQTVVFPEQTTEVTLPVAVYPDSVLGAPKQFRVTIVRTSGPATVRRSSATVTILNTCPHGTNLFADSFSQPAGLITNDYAHFNPAARDARISPEWDMTSGSVFDTGSAAWSGVPDGTTPNAGSTNGTGSAVFRLKTTRTDFGNVDVSLDLRNGGLVATRHTPAVGWDGVHIWLRYQSQYELYAATLNRRDGTVVIKKKVKGGPSNGGTYYDLSPSVSFPVVYGSWERFDCSVRTNADGSVTIAVRSNGVLVVEATDRGAGGAPIVQPGAVGVRGDNANFEFDNFAVRAL